MWEIDIEVNLSPFSIQPYNSFARLRQYGNDRANINIRLIGNLSSCAAVIAICTASRRAMICG
ncbi:hypothetical protein BCON_0310g00010 [Botryotinia convoluta]|uniref:Uncharacterized protein n=1 Tax=Botryotinia convoluta TaxID=54673 RepID=A0A4Z1HP23_9HELO|nr:hypothetical protein BCON_0310g00010 [Botryotinia convoluta]